MYTGIITLIRSCTLNYEYYHIKTHNYLAISIQQAQADEGWGWWLWFMLKKNCNATLGEKTLMADNHKLKVEVMGRLFLAAKIFN